MHQQKIIKPILSALMLFALIVSSTTLFAQHRGDDLSFQGLAYKDNLSARAGAMGGAFSTTYGDVSSLFYNTSGLARIDKIQLSFNITRYDHSWRENQDYRPDRYFVTLPFYLDGMYTPSRANSGQYDYLLAQNPSYLVNPPLLGTGSYDENAADWKRNISEFSLKNFAVAVPFYIGERKFVIAASYLRNKINDFDRNDTYLTPNIGSLDYNEKVLRVNGLDTMNVEWSQFMRQRTGTMNNIVAGLSHEIIKNVMIGAGVNFQTGESDDYQSLIRKGDFHLIDQQRFKFYFVDASRTAAGTSKYKSTSFNMSALVELNRVRLGFKVDLPYKLTREWNYTVNSTVSAAKSGKDEAEMPAVYNMGISFQPVDKFLVAFDYQYAPYSKTKFNLSAPDTTFHKWVDQKSFGVGFEYKLFDYLSLMAGYRVVPEVFIPDGAAVKDKGPDNDSYNFGISVELSFGRFDAAYELRRMKYYDSYYSNTNYVFESNSTLMFGFTYSL